MPRELQRAPPPTRRRVIFPDLDSLLHIATLGNDEACALVISVATGELDDVSRIGTVLESHSEQRS